MPSRRCRRATQDPSIGTHREPRRPRRTTPRPPTRERRSTLCACDSPFLSHVPSPGCDSSATTGSSGRLWAAPACRTRRRGPTRWQRDTPGHQRRWRLSPSVHEGPFDPRRQPVCRPIDGPRSIQGFHGYALAMLEPSPHPTAPVNAPKDVPPIRNAHGHALDARSEATEGVDHALLHASAQRGADPAPGGFHIDPQLPIDGTWPTPPTDDCRRASSQAPIHTCRAIHRSLPSAQTGIAAETYGSVRENRSDRPGPEADQPQAEVVPEWEIDARRRPLLA